VAHVDKCTFWPLLRLAEFHRFDTNYKTRYVFSALRGPQKFLLGQSTSAPWDLAKRSGVHRELNPFSEITALQRKGWNIELVGRAQII
jgi:hypothetical protein